ncbi:MAG: tetratricopeptide repeat protein [Pseudomonadota bacterium]
MRRVFSLLILALVVLSAPLAASWDEGVKAFTSRNFQAAYQHFQDVVQQTPDGFRGHYMLGLTAQQLKRNEDALDHLRKAYDLNPSDVNIQMALGRAYTSVRRYGDAANLLAKVEIGQVPDKAKVTFYQMRAQSYLKTNNTARALADLKTLTQLRPSDATLQYNYGTTALAQGQTDTAIAALSKAAKLDASDANKHKAYANALIKKGRMTKDKAAKKDVYIRAAQAAAQLAKIDSSAANLTLQASAELGAGLFPKAIETAKQAVGKDGNSWLAQFYLGQAYGSAKQYDAAVDPLNKALAIASGNDKNMVHNQLGFVYEKQKAYDKAIAAYQAAGANGSVARVEKNRETEQYNTEVEKENERIEAMRAEAERLEKELEALEQGGGGF